MNTLPQTMLPVRLFSFTRHALAPVMVSCALLLAPPSDAVAQRVTPAPANAPATAPATGTSTGLGRIVGEIVDSLSGRPLRGVPVQAISVEPAGNTRAAVTDGRGRFVLDSLIPGNWALGFESPLLEAVLVQPTTFRTTVIADETREVLLGTPSAASVMGLHCSSARDDGAVIGRVTDYETGAPLENVNVRVRWRELAVGEKRVNLGDRSLEATTTAEGGFILCDLPQIEDITILFTPKDRGLVALPVELVTERARFLDVVISKRLQSNAELRGRVVTEGGRPLFDAEVRAIGASSGTRTDSLGRFVLRGLPPRSIGVVARAIGFEPARFSSAPSREAGDTTRVVLRPQAQQVAAVEVKAKASYLGRDVREGLERRRANSAGTVIFADDPKVQQAPSVADILRNVRGITVGYADPRNPFLWAAFGRANCPLDVYIDGRLAPNSSGSGRGEGLGQWQMVSDNIKPADIAAIEVYPSATSAPVEYPGNSYCGVVVIWRK